MSVSARPTGSRLLAAALPGARALLDLLLPPRCLGCTAILPLPAEGGSPRSSSGDLLQPEHALCPACLPDEEWPPPPCAICATGGAPPAAIRPPRRCRACREAPPPRPRVQLGEYEPPLRGMVLAAKWGGGDDRIAPLAGWLAGRTILAWGSPLPIDAVVGVPRAWTRRLRHGRPIAEDLAAELASVLRRPWIRPLVRRPGRPQAAQSARDRRKIPRGAFRVPDRHRTRVARSHLLLVDDVVTTGATLAACAGALEEAGAASVRTAVLAHVPLER